MVTIRYIACSLHGGCTSTSSTPTTHQSINHHSHPMNCGRNSPPTSLPQCTPPRMDTQALIRCQFGTPKDNSSDHSHTAMDRSDTLPVHEDTSATCMPHHCRSDSAENRRLHSSPIRRNTVHTATTKHTGTDGIIHNTQSVFVSNNDSSQTQRGLTSEIVCMGLAHSHKPCGSSWNCTCTHPCSTSSCMSC
jgi:hypothetical protein